MPPSDRPLMPGRVEGTISIDQVEVHEDNLAGVFDSRQPHGTGAAVLAAILEAHDNDFSVGPEMDEDAEQFGREIRAGLGVPDNLPNANGDVFPSVVTVSFDPVSHTISGAAMAALSQQERSVANEILQQQVTDFQRRQEDMLVRSIASEEHRNRLAEVLSGYIRDRVQEGRLASRLAGPLASLIAGPLLPSNNPSLRDVHIPPIPLQISRLVPDENGRYTTVSPMRSVDAIGPGSPGVEPPFMERVMRRIREGAFPDVSMGTMMPHPHPDDMEGARGEFRQEYRGTFPARQEVTVMGPDEPREPLNFPVRERIGVGVLNPRGVANLGIDRNFGWRGPLPQQPAPEAPRFHDMSWVDNPVDRAAVVRGERVTVPEFPIEANPQVRLSDVRARRFDLMNRTPPPPFPVDSWVMAQGRMLCVEKVGHEMLICRIWDPRRRLFEKDPIGVHVAEATAITPPPGRTVWDWLVDD